MMTIWMPSTIMRAMGSTASNRKMAVFSAYGYVSYFGVMALEELMSEDPAEAYQAQQGLSGGEQNEASEIEDHLSWWCS